MFPLGSVPIPGTLVPLHVFEDRYRALVRHCLDTDRRFGIVLIERGSEVGGGDVRTDVGCVVTIERAGELDDGRWYLVGTCRTRIRVVEWLDDSPYPRAIVEELDDLADMSDLSATDIADLASRIGAIDTEDRRVSATEVEWGASRDLSRAALPVPQTAGEVLAATWVLLARGGLGPADAQGVLATDSVAGRLDLLAAHVADRQSLLSQLIASEGGGEGAGPEA